MSNTPHLNITLLSQAQSQKEVTINLAIQILEALQNTGVISMALSTPPSSPNEGDLYVVKATGTGSWASQDGNFAYFINGGWIFLVPLAGMTTYDLNTSTLYVYNSGFHALIAGTNPDFATLGVNATPSSTNKLSVASVAILFSNIGGDCKQYINKHGTGDGGSVVFETNFSERAEIGCIGDDTFQLKVSPDGSTFYQAWVIDDTTGNTDFKQEVQFDKNLTSNTIGKTLVIKQGSNGKAGTVTLTGATPVTVGNTSVTSGSMIMFTMKTLGGTQGNYPVATPTVGTGFTVYGSALDTSTYNYAIIETA